MKQDGRTKEYKVVCQFCSQEIIANYPTRKTCFDCKMKARRERAKKRIQKILDSVD